MRLLAQAGYAALSLEAVARSAGVSRPTLYRRWTSKATLVAEVISRTATPVDRYATGDLRDDIRSTYLSLLKGLSASAVAPALLVLIGEARYNPELREILRENYLAPRERAAIDLLAEGIAAGRLRGDLPAQVMHQMVMGSLFFGQVALSESLAEETAHQVFTALWEGLARPSTTDDGTAHHA